MKAYIVKEDYDGHCCIQFAEHRATAQSNGANELNYDFAEVSCRRAPEMDKYASQGYVPTQILVMELGWWFECRNCGMHVSQDLEDDEGNPLEPVFKKHHVYCSKRCEEAVTNEREEQERRFAEFKKATFRIFGEQNYQWQGGAGWITMTAKFNVPGCMYPVEFRDQNGDGKYTFSAANIDVPVAAEWLRKFNIKFPG